MENLVEGYDLLDSELRNYIIKNVATDGRNLDIFIDSADDKVKLKLHFEDAQKIDIKGDLYGIVSIILHLGIKKIGNITVKVNIVSLLGVNISVTARRLYVKRL